MKNIFTTTSNRVQKTLERIETPRYYLSCALIVLNVYVAAHLLPSDGPNVSTQWNASLASEDKYRKIGLRMLRPNLMPMLDPMVVVSYKMSNVAAALTLVMHNESGRKVFHCITYGYTVILSILIENAICSAIEIHRLANNDGFLFVFLIYASYWIAMYAILLHYGFVYSSTSTWSPESTSEKHSVSSDPTADEVINHAFNN